MTMHEPEMDEAAPPSIDPETLGDEIAALGHPLLAVFDCDGVLAPIVGHAAASRLVPGVEHLLGSLADIDHVTVAVVSGRSLGGLEQFGFPPSVHLVGSYGFEERGRPTTGLDDDELELLEHLARLVDAGSERAGDGSWVEHKPASVVLHTREADPRRASDAIRWVEQETIADAPEAAIHHGDQVIELQARPTDKGSALIRLRRRHEPDAIVYLGDDVPDEDAFALLGEGDLPVQLGRAGVFPSRPTRARRRLGDPVDVPRVLERLLDRFA